MNGSIEQFRAKLHVPRLITAPSGNQYVVQRLTTLDYLKEGLSDIPNNFAQFVVTVTAGLKSDLSEEEQKKNYELVDKFMAVTVSKGLIDPPCVMRWDETKKDTHLLWSELNDADQNYIVGCITGRIEDKTIQPSNPNELKFKAV